MKNIAFTSDEMDQIRGVGLTPDQVFDQITLFHKGTPYLNLDRPCIVGDGIIQLSPDNLEKNIAIFEREALQKTLVKFVPASGAASRMVKILIKAVKNYPQIKKADVESGLFSGQKENQDLHLFITNIDRFACYKDLESLMKRQGSDLDGLASQGDFKDILESLVTEKGLDYAHMPKGLIKFHDYPEGSRTAFEEHLVEAAGYAVSIDRRCSIHYTVSPSHMDKFQTLLQKIKPQYESSFNVTFDISFSIQEKKLTPLLWIWATSRLEEKTVVCSFAPAAMVH